MAISLIGHNSAAATTATVTAHAIGDYIVIFAYRNAVTAPTLPAGFTSIVTSSGNANSFIVGYKIATATNDASGTWTNANVLHTAVYRGVTGIGAKVGATKAASTTATISALTLLGLNGNSWVAAFAGSKQTTAQGTPLAGATTSRGAQAGTTSNAIWADTNAGVSSFSATTSSNNTSVTSSGGAVELLCSDLAVSLTDDFSGGSIDSTKWVPYNDTGVTVAQTGGQLVISETAVTSASGGMESARHFNLTGSQVTITMPDNTLLLSQPLAFSLPYLHLPDDTFAIYWRFDNDGVVRAVTRIAGVESGLVGITYNSVSTLYWKISESGGTVTWSHSANGSSWTDDTTIAVSALFPVTDFITGSQLLSSGLVTAGSIAYDNWNILSSAVNATVTQVAATVTAAGGTQVVTAASSSSVTQVAATVTATGGTQTALTIARVTQVAGTVTAAGGTQVIATVQIVAVTQVAGTVTAAGGTQVVTSMRIIAVAQVAGSVTAAGGTQVVVSVQKGAVAQIAATVTASGGTQVVAPTRFAVVTQVSATVTVTGGTQVLVSFQSGTVAQVAATVTATGGVQIIFVPPHFVNITKTIGTSHSAGTINDASNVANVDSTDTIRAVESPTDSTEIVGASSSTTITTTNTNT